MHFKTVKLKAEWLGHSKGSEVTIQTPKADELISRGVAKEVLVEKPTEKVPSVKTKQVEKPAVDKQVKRPARSK